MESFGPDSLSGDLTMNHDTEEDDDGSSLDPVKEAWRGKFRRDMDAAYTREGWVYLGIGIMLFVGYILVKIKEFKEAILN